MKYIRVGSREAGWEKKIERPEEGRWLALDGRRTTIENPKIGLGMNSDFTEARELCSVRCTEGDTLRCGRGVGWYCRHRAGNFIVSFMPPAHLNTV